MHQRLHQPRPCRPQGPCKGLFRALYRDRGSHSFHTPEAGGKVDKSNPTQVGRALAQPGPPLPRLRRRIEHIAAYSPEARGRSERAFATLQDRLVKELKLAGITSVEAAKRFIAEDDLPDHNGRFATPPEQPESAFVPASLEQARDILRRQEERTVGNDNSVSYRGLRLQIPPSPMRYAQVPERGLSPHMRGNPCLQSLEAVFGGSIPAHAGEPNRLPAP